MPSGGNGLLPLGHPLSALMTNKPTIPLSVPAAAQYLGVSPSCIRVAIEKKTLPAVNIGTGARRHLRIDPADLDRYAEARRV